jgi:hypothetical protein
VDAAGRGGWYEWWHGDVVASAAKCHEHYVIVVDADLFARPVKTQRMAGSGWSSTGRRPTPVDQGVHQP